MKYLYASIVFALVLFLGLKYFFSPPLPKEVVSQNINDWYASIGDQYRLNIKGNQASANITRYHPERPEEKDDLIEITYRGMRIQLMFYKTIAEVSTHKDSLQKYFNYVSIDDIYNEIPARGWEIYPETPQSTLSGEGVQFLTGGTSLGLQINWSTYTVRGYQQSRACQDEALRMDMPITEECRVSVDKSLPLQIVVDNIPFD